MTPPPARRSDPITGILCLVGGLAVFSLQDLVVKLLAGTYAVHQVLATRSLTALPLFLLLAWRDGGLGQLTTGNLGAMVLRGAIMFFAFTCYYLALVALPLATSVALYFTAPLFIMVLTVLLLGEPVGRTRWAAVLLGFAGTIVIVQPGAGIFDLAVVLPILAAFFYAVAQIVARRYAASGNAVTFSFHANLGFLLGAALAGLLLGHGAFADQSHPSLAFLLRPWTVPPAGDLALMMLCGVVAATGSTLLAQAYRIASPPIVAPFEYTAIVWSVLNGYLIWSELPATATWAGIAIIVAAGLYGLTAERRGKPT